MLLVIGNKRYSSWSLRPWILLKHFAIPFDEKIIPLDQPDTTANILRYSPSGRVPALIDGEITIWDSLAIAEYLHERFPDKKMWPEPVASRAWARSIANEMHSGFQTLREHMPHDLQKQLSTFDISPAHADIQRIFAIWTECLKVSRGPFLLGQFSIADAMYAPVANRFVSYGVTLPTLLEKYVQTIRTLPAHAEWIAAAGNEELRMPRYEN